MLTEKQRDQLRDVLKGERNRLVRNAQDGLQFAMNRDREKVGRDSIDESMEEELFSTELRLRDREKFLISKIDSALERLENKSIDECEDCGEAISFKRLLARPVTTLCVECKEEREREEQAQSQSGRGGSVAGVDSEMSGSDEVSSEEG